MQAIYKTMPVPADRRLRLDEPLPQTIGAGQMSVTIIIQEQPGTQTPPRPRRTTGFLKGRVSCPDDFDTMGQEEIIALFEGDS